MPTPFAEFFAGIGLVRLAFEQADPAWRCAFSNDLDPAKRALYANHFGDEPNPADIHDLSADSIPDTYLATASFPCTDLSLAGGRRGIHHGAQSSAFWGFHRILSEMGRRRPPLVLLENVLGLITSNNGQDFHDVLRAMNDLGYAVDPVVLDARWFVPQSRPRLFVVCRQTDDVNAPALLNPTRLRPQRLTQFITAHPDIRWSLADLPEPPERSQHTLTDIITDPPEDHPDWWNRERTDYLRDQMFDRHLAWVDRHIDSPTHHYATAFRRVRRLDNGVKKSMAELRTDGVAGCLRTPKGGSAKQILVRAGQGELRARLLSARECAALMGAPEYTLDCTLSQALFAFGDAVCVPAVTWLARHALSPQTTKTKAHAGAT